jgi:hypothetical protein
MGFRIVNLMRIRKMFVLCAAVALAGTFPGVAAQAQSQHGPTRDVVPRGRISALVWMIGNWECHIVDRKQPDYATRMWRRVALGPGGQELYVLEGMPDFVSRGKIGFSEKSGQWYEIDRVGEGQSKEQQTLVAPPAALKPNGLTLEGYIPGKKKGDQFPLRGVYSWTGHDGFIFRAQLLRKDQTWLTFQKQSCERSDQGPA